MRFLCASNFVRDPDSGSAGSIVSIGEALAARGHDVDYLWRPAGRARIPHDTLSNVFELPRRQYRQVADELQRTKYDVVVISQPYAYLVYEDLAPRHPQTLFLNRTHGWEDRFNAARARLQWSGPQPFGRRLATRASRALVDRACRRTIRACHGLIAPSRRDVAYVQSRYGVPADKLAAIPYGVDPEFLEPPPARASSGAVRMLYVGHYIPVKGSGVLESVLPPLGRAHQHAQITFVVPDDAGGRIRDRFGPAFGDRLTVLPWRSRAELPAVYAGHDLQLFPSLFEGFGKAFLEGMVSGLCVVGFDEGGLSEIAVSGEQAFYCQTGDAGAFTSLLDRCLRDPELTHGVGRQAREAARPYTWARTAERTERLCVALRGRIA